MTHSFSVPDMSCGHCAQTITKAVRSVDGDADIRIDLDAKRVTVESGSGEAALAAAIEEAGFTVAR